MHYKYQIMPYGLVSIYISTKYEFHITSTTFLGYIISYHGVEMDLSSQSSHRIATAYHYQKSSMIYWFCKALQKIYYSIIAAPLTSLLKDKPNFNGINQLTLLLTPLKPASLLHQSSSILSLTQDYPPPLKQILARGSGTCISNYYRP